MDSAAAALAILIKLQSLGFCADLCIPDDVVASDPSKAFETVLEAFLRDVYPGRLGARLLPAMLGDGRRVDLLHLFLAVLREGGYAALSSAPIDGGWAAAAESAGLDASLAAPVKLIYAKYLGALDHWIQRIVESQGPFLDGVGWKKQALSSGASGVENREPLLNCNEREKKDMVLKRKTEDVAGMLDWIRAVAEDTQNGGAVTAGSADGGGYFSMVLALREATNRKRARRASMAKEMFPVACKCCMSSTCAQLDGSGTGVGNINASSLAVEGKHVSRSHHRCSDGLLFTTQRRNAIPVGPEYQAEVPQWTGKTPENYDDPETMKWLGTQVWPPANVDRKELFPIDPIGKVGDVVCSCKFPGSVECVRFHVAERRLQLKSELGSAFFAMGFDRMGEEIALSWTGEEEANFKSVAQLKVPYSGRNFWNRLHSSFRQKGRKELVSYYFNCFLLRQRCYQNRITPKNIDSDDDEEKEFKFFRGCLGDGAVKYQNTKNPICTQNMQCMDLD